MAPPSPSRAPLPPRAPARSAGTRTPLGNHERVLRALVARHPGYRDGWAFLAALLEGQGRSTEAADLYRRAAETAALAAADRTAFGARARARPAP